MTTTEMMATFRRIVDDSSVDQDTILDFINTGKDELDLERDWIWLTQHDFSSIVWASGDTYLTQHSLPTGFLREVNVYVDGFEFAFDQVPWEDRYRTRNIAFNFSIDYFNKKIHFMGTTASNHTVDLSYIADQGDLALGDTPNGWPSKLHRIFVYKAAELWLAGTDADNITKLMASEHAKQYALLKRRAVMMDAKLRGKARNYSSQALKSDTSAVSNVLGWEEINRD